MRRTRQNTLVLVGFVLLYACGMGLLILLGAAAAAGRRGAIGWLLLDAGALTGLVLCCLGRLTRTTDAELGNPPSASRLAGTRRLRGRQAAVANTPGGRPGIDALAVLRLSRHRNRTELWAWPCPPSATGAQCL